MQCLPLTNEVELTIKTTTISAMTTQKLDPTLDRLLRHMAWANAHVLGKLMEIPSSALLLAPPNSEWTVGAIVEHYVRSAGFYGARLGAAVPEFVLHLPSSRSDLLKYRELSATNDARLRELAAEPEGQTTFIREGRKITRARSTILGQSIHHAIEHRAQIADILVMHGINAIDLDEIDVWALGDTEGLGE